MTWTLADLDGNTTLLTVNNRLAVELRARYDRLQSESGLRVWPSADILPWNAWLTRCYEHLLDSGFTSADLLDANQERLLWENIVEQSSRAQNQPQLLRAAAAARQAQAAHLLIADWQLDEARLKSSGGEELSTFLEWRERFQTALSDHALISAAALLPLITAAFDEQVLNSPARLVYSGFDTLSPAQQQLFERLRQRNTEIVEHLEPLRTFERTRLTADDSDAEIRLAAQWAKQRLANEANVRIGIVSPRISEQRQDLQRIFAETLTPQHYLAAGGDAQPLFNLSLGEPLDERPLVAHALLALTLLTREHALNDIGQLLRSPFLGGYASEWENRALFDAALRDDGLPRISVERLQFRLGGFDVTDYRHCADLLSRLTKLVEFRDQLPRRCSPNQWVGHLQALLGILGWPGEQTLDSHEYQQHERFKRVFSEFAALGKVQPSMSLTDALTQLRTLTHDTVFQPQSPATPIQILGGLEAAGMDFDAIWLLGLDDQTWPASPQPNPLLPAALQRELDMPNASASRELAFARRLTERLCHSAPLVIASHARQCGDREQRASPLIRDWPSIDASELVGDLRASLRDACAQHDGLLPLPDKALRRPPSEQRGGAALLAAQANCPFQAVARFRLAARPLAEASFNVDAAIVGNLVHDLLQRVWQQLHDSATLAQHDDASLRDLIVPLAQATLADLGRRRPDLFSPRFQAIETQRLTHLLIDWLNSERSRSQPFCVEQLERSQLVELGELRLHTRTDRIDRLADGTLAVIDYKTGRQVNNSGWFDDRVTEPQVPLYCLHSDGEVSAALLARVRRDQAGCSFVGVSRDEGFAQGVITPQSYEEETDWSTLLDHWRWALANLADEIRHGRADATPSPQACGYCPYGDLCRVQEMLGEDDA